MGKMMVGVMEWNTEGAEEGDEVGDLVGCFWWEMGKIWFA